MNPPEWLTIDPLPLNRARLKVHLNYTLPRHLLLILGTAVLIFARDHTLFLAGQFVAEDSFFFYATAYNKSFFAAIATPYAGYLHVLPMAIAELLWNLPFSVLPWVNHAVAIVLCATCLSWFYAPACRVFVRSDGLRFGWVPLLALVPFQPNVGMILGLHWYLAFMMCLMLLGEPPKGKAVIASWSVLALGAAWTAPALAVVVPIAAFRWFRLRNSPSRYFFLCLTTGVIAHATAAVFIFRPASASQVFATPSTALTAFGEIVTHGLLVDAVAGTALGRTLSEAGLSGAFAGLTSIALVWLLWKKRTVAEGRYAILLLVVAGAVLFLAMIRGRQSALMLEYADIRLERYLTIPTLIVWTALLILTQSWFERLPNRATRTVVAITIVGWSTHLALTEPPLAQSETISAAIPHSRKVETLRRYEARVAAGGPPETLALPGWTPLLCMKLDVGGGRSCDTPSDLRCLFASDLQTRGKGRAEVTWLGTFEYAENSPEVSHPTLGRIEMLGYHNGFFSYRDSSGQVWLTGPAIFPDAFEWPPRNSFSVNAAGTVERHP